MDQFTDKALAIVITGMYGLFGSLVHYLYEIVRDDTKSFQTWLFLINGVFGFFIGIFIGDFLPDSFKYRDGVLLLSGFLVYQILDLIETRGLRLMLQKYLGLTEKDHAK